jgi:HrpA-like RNA helicase
MTLSTTPEILRTDMTNVILLLLSIGIDNIFTFDFIIMPSIDSIRYGFETLYCLGAIDDTTKMTPLGYEMAQLSVEPRLARMLFESIQYNCTWEVITIASVIHILQSTDYYEARSFHLLQTKRKQRQQRIMDYENVMSNVADMTGDHVSYWNIFTDMDHQYGGIVDHDYCEEHFLQYHTVQQCLQVRRRLAQSLKRIRSNTTIGTFQPKHDEQQMLSLDPSQAIRRCVTTGYIMNVAKLHNDGQYYTMRKDSVPVPVVPSKYSFYSSHSKISSEYIVFSGSGGRSSSGGSSNDATDRIEIHHVSAIEAKWLRDIAPLYLEYTQ